MDYHVSDTSNTMSLLSCNTMSRSSSDHRCNQMDDVGVKHQCRSKDTVRLCKTSFTTLFVCDERPQFLTHFTQFFKLKHTNPFLSLLRNGERNRKQSECVVVNGSGQSGVQSECVGTPWFRNLSEIFVFFDQKSTKIL